MVPQPNNRIFDRFTSTLLCGWAFVLLLGQAHRLDQCRQLFLITNQSPFCLGHPVSPDLCYWAGVEPALMDRQGIEPCNVEQWRPSHPQTPPALCFLPIWILSTFWPHKPPFTNSGAVHSPIRMLPQIICFYGASLLLHPPPIFCLQGLCRPF